MAKTIYLAFALVGVGASWACVDSSEARKDADDAGAAASARSEQGGRQRAVNVTRLYIDTCAKCHGQNGEGGGAGTKTLLTLDKFDQKHDKPYFDAIKDGVPDMGMEAYGATLSDEEIWALVVHIRELQYRAMRQEHGGPKATDGVYKSKYHSYRIETVVDRDQGLRTPWAIDWLPDGRMIVTNRPGKMVVVKDGKVQSEVSGIPESVEIGQGGLMDVTTHPDYAKNGWIYLSYTEPALSGRGGMSKVVRGKLSFEGTQARWTDQQTIWETDQQFYTGAGVHFGCKIVFDGKGHVFIGVGERGTNMRVQDLTTPFGKVVRLNDDGTVPKDNPFASTKGAEAFWTLGHRNQQGLAFDLEGRLWGTEHAPRGGDELNQIVKGENYGWPVISFAINYNDSPFVTPWPKPGQNFRMPIFRWLPSNAASGLDVNKGQAFAQWKGDLFAGGLAGQNLDRIRVGKDGKLAEREELVWGMGRVRDVMCGPDGYVYLALNQPDIVVRLVPAK